AELAKIQKVDYAQIRASGAQFTVPLTAAEGRWDDARTAALAALEAQLALSNNEFGFLVASRALAAEADRRGAARADPRAPPRTPGDRHHAGRGARDGGRRAGAARHPASGGDLLHRAGGGGRGPRPGRRRPGAVADGGRRRGRDGPAVAAGVRPAAAGRRAA